MKVAVKLDLYLEIEFSENVDRGSASVAISELIIPAVEKRILNCDPTLSSTEQKAIRKSLPSIVDFQLLTKRQLLGGK